MGDAGPASPAAVYPRRAVLGVAAAASSAAGLLAACGPARPGPAQAALTLTVALDVYALAQYGTAQTRAGLYAEVLKGFEQSHPGIRVRQTPFLATAQNQTAIIAGSAPDVFPDCCTYGTYVYAGLLLPLDTYLQRDNVTMSVFAPGMVDWLAYPSGTFGLSRETDANAFAVNLGVLDELGLTYPDTAWTNGDLARLCAAAVKTPATGAKRFGARFIYGGFRVLQEFTKGFGGQVLNAERTVQSLSSPGCTDAARWWFQDLFWPGLATSGFTASVTDTAIQNLDMNNVLHLYTVWKDQTKWALYPAPVYPRGRSTGMAGNFWGIASTTRNPDQAWELLRWLALESVWQRFAMRTFLFPPALNSLLAEWQQTVEAVVPALKGKGLGSFTEAASQGWARVADINFRYATSQATAVDDLAWSQIQARRVGVTEALVQADRQVNSIEQSAPVQRAAARSAAAQFPVHGPSVANVPAGL